MFAFFLLVSIGLFAGSRGTCPIESYSSTSCFDSRGESVYIDSSFRSSMNKICAAAINCNVKLWITSSYREPDSPVPGAIVTPAKSSNHNIGHAIDMNVVYGTSNAVCSSKCLRGDQPAPVKCFISAVKRAGLRWGGDFKEVDSVHIDDYYNGNDDSYKNLLNKIQKEC